MHAAPCMHAAPRMLAVLIPYEAYLRFQALKEEQVLARFDRLITRIAEQNVAASEDAVAGDVASAVAELRD